MNKTIRSLILITIALSVVNAAFARGTEVQGPRTVTLWWVVFNQPEHCYGSIDSQAQCTNLDVFGSAFLASIAYGSPDYSLIAPNTKARIAVLYATFGITDEQGHVTLASTIRKQSKQMKAVRVALSDDSLDSTIGFENDDAEIHLVVRDHGRPKWRDIASQLGTVPDVYCADSRSTDSGSTDSGTARLLSSHVASPTLCVDTQHAVFGAIESGRDSMQAFADPFTQVPGSYAHLLREVGEVKAVVKVSLPTYSL